MTDSVDMVSTVLYKIGMSNQERDMTDLNIKVIANYMGFSHTGYKVFVDGTKYPRERGYYYETTSNEKAIEFALAEHAGKYLSRGGVIYDSREDYLKTMEEA